MKQTLSRCVLMVTLTCGFFLQGSLADNTQPDLAKANVEKAAKALKEAEERAAQCQKDYDQTLEKSISGAATDEDVAKADEALQRAKADVQLAQKNLAAAQKAAAPPAPPSPLTPKVTPPSDKPAGSANNNSDVNARIAQLERDLQQQKKMLAQVEEDIVSALKSVRDIADALTKLPLDKDIATLHPFVKGATPYLGTPYVFGGASSRGIDCSGLIMRVAQRLGLDLPHSAAELYKYGIPIAKSLLKPGDLVFFRDTYKPGISHVGIYVGKGRFLHASSVSKGVVVSDLNAAVYVKHYAGARRLLSAVAKEEKK